MIKRFFFFFNQNRLEKGHFFAASYKKNTSIKNLTLAGGDYIVSALRR